MVIIFILFIICIYLFVLSPGRRVVGAWHVAVLAVLWPSAQHTGWRCSSGGGGGTDRNAESDGTRSRRRCGADPNPCPHPLPLHTDGDVCGEGVKRMKDPHEYSEPTNRVGG